MTTYCLKKLKIIRMSNYIPLISVIIVSHNGRYIELKKVLNELSFQTYKNIEIIIVGNNITGKMNDFLISWEKTKKLNNYLNYNKHIMDHFDHSKIGRFRYQKGLEASSGDLLYFQSDDDLLAHDYFERIVKLFEIRPDCVSAIGNSSGEYFWEEKRFVQPIKSQNIKNIKFDTGKKVLFDHFNKKRLGNPGFCYVFKRSLLNLTGDKIWYGYDTSILLSLVSQGISGVDPNALMYWGRHSSKMSSQMKIYNNKYLTYKDQMIVRDKVAIKVWEQNNFTKKEIKELNKFLKKELAMHSAHGLLYAIRNFNIILFYRHLKIIIKNDITSIFICFGEVYRFIRYKLKV